MLATWNVDEFEESATLLVSELVTNAVLHARSPAELTMRLDAGELWVGVSDGNAGPAMRKRYGADAATGRGLLLVERIATAWGTEPAGTGKLVWFQLAPGAGESAMVGAEAEFAADLAELAGSSGRGGGAGPRHAAQSRPPDGGYNDLRSRRQSHLSRRPGDRKDGERNTGRARG